jgi:acyl-CoA thioesterase
MSTPIDILNMMMAKDYFSQWLGIEVLEITEGKCKLKMQIKKDMLNGFGIAHGGITYSFADSALAFASNSYGKKAVSIETSISHLVSLLENDVITAEVFEQSNSNKIAIYTVDVIKQATNQKIAMFKGTVYKTDKNWF